MCGFTGQRVVGSAGLGLGLGGREREDAVITRACFSDCA